MAASDTIEAEGHLIDSGHLSAIFDKIIELKGSYEVLKFNIGRTNDDPSRITMRVTAADAAALWACGVDGITGPAVAALQAGRAA